MTPVPTKTLDDHLLWNRRAAIGRPLTTSIHLGNQARADSPRNHSNLHNPSRYRPRSTRIPNLWHRLRDRQASHAMEVSPGVYWPR